MGGILETAENWNSAEHAAFPCLRERGCVRPHCEGRNVHRETEACSESGADARTALWWSEKECGEVYCARAATHRRADDRVLPSRPTAGALCLPLHLSCKVRRQKPGPGPPP